MPVNGADRAKAYRIKRLLEKDPRSVTPQDKAWFEAYHSARAEKRATERIVHVEERTDEQAAAVGDGAIDASPLLAREEGQRVDTLVTLATDGLCRALEYHQAMADMLIGRVAELTEAMTGLVDALAASKLQMADAEAKAIVAAATGGEDDAIGQFVKGFAEGAASKGKPAPRRRTSAADVRRAVEAAKAKKRTGREP